MLLFTDILEETAARPLVDAVPVLGRRHVVAVASAADPDLTRIVTTLPKKAREVHAQTAALEVLEARRRVRTSLGGSGAQVIEAPPGQLGAACVQAYLRAKARAQL